MQVTKKTTKTLFAKTFSTESLTINKDATDTLDSLLMNYDKFDPSNKYNEFLTLTPKIDKNVNVPLKEELKSKNRIVRDSVLKKTFSKRHLIDKIQDV